MLEIVLLFVFILVASYFTVFLYWPILLVLLIIIAPGMYAMVWGAPFVDTLAETRKIMIKLADLKKGDRVVDLGCGSGRLIRAAAKRGVKEAVGYELSVPTYVLARFLTFFQRGKESIRYGNFWKKDFSEMDVLFCFLMKKSMAQFEKKIWPKLKSGTRVVSNAVKLKIAEPVESSGGVYLYVKK